MEEDKENISEVSILEAARQVFMEKGMAGARMQEIADRAGINKAMLHYYFRSKDQLFDKVFQEAFQEFWPKVEDAMLIDAPEKAIRDIVEAYITVFSKKPFLPNFILSEMHRSPERIGGLMQGMGVDPMKVGNYLGKMIEEGKLKAVNPKEMIVTVLSLCVFPFAARPLLRRMILKDEREWDVFIDNRVNSVMAIIEQCYFL